MRLFSRFNSFATFSLVLLGGISANGLATTITNSAAAGVDTSTQTCSDLHETSFATCSLGGSIATATVNNGKGGNVFVSSGSNPTSSAVAALAYFVSVNGPSGVAVPVVITGTSAMSALGVANYGLVEADSSGNGIATELTAAFEATASDCQQYLSVTPKSSCYLPGAFAIKTSLPSNGEIAVSMVADIGGADGYAMLDPIITIDPAFALAKEFTVVPDASGIFPSAPTVSPEPLSLALFALGLGAMFVLIGCQRIRARHGQ